MTFEGIRPVLHLAFEKTPDELIRFGDLDRLIDRILASGVDGLVVLGLASEAWTLTEDEREAVVGHVAAAVAQRVPLVVGIEGATAVAIARGRRAAARGASGLMVPALLRGQGVIGSDRLRSPARSLDPEEEATLDRLFADLEGAEIPGFARVAA